MKNTFDDELKDIHHRGFRDYDLDSFCRVWCELADVVGVSPSELSPETELGGLFPKRSRWSMMDPPSLEEFEHWMLRKTRRKRLPTKADLSTVGALVHFLLEIETETPERTVLSRFRSWIGRGGF